MEQTIKQKIYAQIYLNQKLLSYDQSDSQECEEDKIMNSQPNCQIIQISKKCAQSHTQLNLKKQKALRQILLNQNQKISAAQRNQCRQLKIVKQEDKKSNETIVQLKSKLAQVLKQSQLKTRTIQEVQKKIWQVQNSLDLTNTSLNDKQTIIMAQQQEIGILKFYQEKIKIQYEARIFKIQEQQRKQIEDLNKNIQMQSETIKINQNKLKQFENLINLKNQEVEKINKIMKKTNKSSQQNQKLKFYIKKLLHILQSQQKNLKTQQKNKLNDKINQLKQKWKDQKIILNKSCKQRTKSLLNQSNFMVIQKNKTLSDASKFIDSNYLSLREQTKQNITWFPTFLISQVQCFLKKWRIGFNNQSFVNGLVEFISQYTDKCVYQNRNRMQNQYKSLKKQIQRKANQSLSIQEVLKLSEINKKHEKYKTNQSNTVDNDSKNLRFQTDNISVLIPASNKNYTQESRKNYLTLNLMNQQIKNKDQAEYTNLQKSIRVHHEKSYHKIQKPEFSYQKVKVSTKKQNKSVSKKVKTQSSAQKSSIKSKSKNKNKSRKIQNNKFQAYSLQKYKFI